MSFPKHQGAFISLSLLSNQYNISVGPHIKIQSLLSQLELALTTLTSIGVYSEKYLFIACDSSIAKFIRFSFVSIVLIY